MCQGWGVWKMRQMKTGSQARLTDRHTDEQTDRLTDRQTDRQTDQRLFSVAEY